MFPAILGSLFPTGLPLAGGGVPSSNQQAPNSGSQTVGAFTVGGASNQMYIFAGVAVLLIVVIVVARK